MYRSSWNLRNFKKGLRLVENIARQNTTREVDFATGYAIAHVADLKEHGRITKAQKKALEDLIYDTAEDTIDEIERDEHGVVEDGLHILSMR